MLVQFESVKAGTSWDRNELARLWGYKSFHAIARGVVTPAGGNKIILFVTEKKQEDFTQYSDKLHNGLLEWEGEKGHTSDSRIVDAAKRGDEIHIFYRERHHARFIYLGIVLLQSHELLSDAPSKFSFRIDH